MTHANDEKCWCKNLPKPKNHIEERLSKLETWAKGEDIVDMQMLSRIAILERWSNEGDDKIRQALAELEEKVEKLQTMPPMEFMTLKHLEKKGLPFEKALSEIRDGHKVRREVWDECYFINIKKTYLYADILSIEDILANDWIVIGE